MIFSLRNLAFLGILVRGWTYEDDFTTDNWTDAGSGISVNTGTEVLDWNFVKDGTNTQSVHDLTSVSDTAWVLQFKCIIATIVNSTTSNNHGFFVIDSKDSTQVTGVVQDALGMAFERLSSGTSTIYAFEADNSSLDAAYTGDASFAHALTVETIYVRMIRESATVFTVELFSDASYTTSIEKETVTTSSTVTALRYIKVARQNTTAVGGTLDGTLDDLKFANGVTEPPT